MGRSRGLEIRSIGKWRLPVIEVTREYVPDWRFDEQAMWLDTAMRLSGVTVAIHECKPSYR